MNRILSILVVLASLAFGGMSATDGEVNTGKARWEKPVVTVNATVLGENAKAVLTWNGVEGAPEIHLTDGPADVTFSRIAQSDRMKGGEAFTDYNSEGWIQSCTVEMPPVNKWEAMAVAHEMGHCLGLRHDHDIKAQNLMFWMASGKTVTPTDADLANLGSLYAN